MSKVRALKMPQTRVKRLMGARTGLSTAGARRRTPLDEAQARSGAHTLAEIIFQSLGWMVSIGWVISIFCFFVKGKPKNAGIFTREEQCDTIFSIFVNVIV